MLFSILAFCAARAIATSSDTPFTGGILSVTAAPAVTTSSALDTGNCNRAGPVNQTGSYLFVNDNIVPPTSYFVPCSSFLSKYGLYTTPNSTQTTSTHANPYPSGLVACGSLVANNQSLTGSTIVNTYSGSSFIERTQACTAWAASRKSFADSPLGTISALYSACQYQAVRNDIDKNPTFAGITGNVVAQVYPGSELGSSYSEFRKSSSFPLAYSSVNPSGGRVTTMPCASFQAAYVPRYQSIASTYDNWKETVISFWRSPQCTSMAKASNSSRPAIARRQVEFQSWNGELGVPFGPAKAVHQVGVGANIATCCGPCQVVAQTLSMLYWPVGSTTPICSDGPVTSIATSIATSPPEKHLVARRLSNVNGTNASSVYTVVDGSTLKSPSVYMAFQGSVWVSDLCGTLGSALTSLTIAVDPRSVSSIEWNADGADGGSGGYYTNKPFDFEACPTFGWSDPFTTSVENPDAAGEFSYFITSTIGPPYHPIVSPIPELHVAQPAYSQCSAWRSVGYRAEPFYGAYDPPRALRPVDAMAAPTSSAATIDPATTATAMPQQTASVELPQITASAFDPVLPDLQPQASSPAPVAGAKDPNRPTMASETSDTHEAPHPTTPSLSLKPQGGLSSGSDRAQPEMPTGGPQGEIDPSTRLSTNGGSTDPKTAGVASADEANPSPIPAASTRETLAPLAGESQKVQTPTNGAMNAKGSSEAADSHVIAPGATTSVPDGTDVSIDRGSNAKAATDSSDNHVKATVMTLDSSTFTVDENTHLVIEGQTLKQGQAITVHSTPISYVTGGSNVVVGSITQALSATQVEIAHETVITFGGSTYTASSSAFVVHGQTLTPGGAITVASTPLSYKSGGSELVIGTSTQTLPATAVGVMEHPVVAFAGSTYTEKSSAFIIHGQTLTPGGAITVADTTLSYKSGDSEIVIGTSTQTLPTTAVPVTEHPVVTFAGSTYTAKSSEFVIHGQTLSKGSAITVSGTPISFAAAGTDVVVGSSTQAVDLGSYIMGGFRTGPATEDGPRSNSIGTPTPFMGSQPRLKINLQLLYYSIAIATAIVVLMIW